MEKSNKIKYNTLTLAIAKTKMKPLFQHKSLYLSLREQLVKYLDKEKIPFLKSGEKNGVSLHNISVRNSPNAHFIIDGSANLLESNKVGAKLLKRITSEEGIKNFNQLLSPESLDDFSHFLSELFKSNNDHSCVVKITLTDNTDVYLLLQGVICKDPTKAIVTAIDITDIKRKEIQYLENEKRFRLFYEHAPLSYQSLDSKGCIIDVNPSWLNTLGYKREEVIGRPFSDIMTPKSASLVPERFSTFIKNGEIHDLIFEMIRKDGTIITVSYNGNAGYDEKGNFRQTYCIFHDVTEQNKEEAALREREFFFKESQRAGNVGSYKFVINDNQWTSSTVLDHIFGVDPHYPKTFEGWLQLIHPDDREKMNKYFQEQILLKGLTFDKEYRIVRPSDGQLRWVHGVGQLVYNDQSQLSEMYGIIQDITERKETDYKILELNEQLKALNATKDKFFSLIAHDLKNPFISIIGFSNILSEQIANKNLDGIEEYSGIIHDSAERALLLLTNLFQWARSQTGRLTFLPEEFELVAVCDEAIKLNNDGASQKAITVTREITGDTTVWADKNMISTILRNLLSNAIKFTKAGGKVEVMITKDKKEVLVTVRDNGVGIRENDLYKLWRIDENLSTKGTNKEMGTGLGLIICKEFVAKHGGKIWAESKLNQGSSFYFTIPCKKYSNHNTTKVVGEKKSC